MSGIIAQNSGRHTGLVKAASAAGVWNLIETFTSDGSDATADFTSGIDSTYDEYVFKFINIHPETDDVQFQFQADTGTNTSYNQTITSTFFQYYHTENDVHGGGGYVTSNDQAEGTAFQPLLHGIGGDNDQNVNGTLQIFSPSSSTFVKHFIATGNRSSSDDASISEFCAGYFNTTTALTRVQFKMSADEIQAGSISLYGIS